ncbi:MAG: fused MFS/spermidine synthase [Pseudomonadota bacterium]
MHRYSHLFWGLMLLVTPGADAAAEKVYDQRSLYSRVVVNRNDHIYCLQFSVQLNLRNQSCINKRKPRKLIFEYTKMAMASLLFTPEPKAILVVGLGGGTLPMAFTRLFPEAHIDAIEIDADVVKVAEQYFEFRSDEKIAVHIRDARVWTKRALRGARRYDLIFLDAFNGEYIPEHLMTREYLQETQALLAPGGTLMANTFAVSDLYDHESATYADVFGGFINFAVVQTANRMITVAPAVEDEILRERATALRATLRPYDVPIRRYARQLIRLRNKAPDWDTEARVLTDQFSPANLLRNRR